MRHQQQVRFERADIRDFACDGADRWRNAAGHGVCTWPAQVAVTTSVSNPREDFEINALGTFNVLDAVRTKSPESFFINASTNKVYGKMDDIGVVERNGRYEYSDLPNGVGEDRPMDFHSPYGCSKGAADQYTIDYARIYGIQSVTFRQSCIYGTRQFGVEDQGWVAWFTIAAVLGKTITIYGDGKQTRDVLHVQDLARAYEAAFERRETVAGQAFNIGGGPTTSCRCSSSSATSKRTLTFVSLCNGVIGGQEISQYSCAISRRQSDFSSGSLRFPCAMASANSSAGCAITKSYSTADMTDGNIRHALREVNGLRDPETITVVGFPHLNWRCNVPGAGR